MVGGFDGRLAARSSSAFRLFRMRSRIGVCQCPTAPSSVDVPATDVGAYYLAYLACLPVSLAAFARSQATQSFLAESGQSPEAARIFGE